MSKAQTDLGTLGDVTILQATRTLHIKHPSTGEPLYLNDDKSKPIVVQYVGQESDEFERANHENRKITNERAMRGAEYDPAIEDRAVYRTIAYCTKGWSNVPKGWITGDTKDLTPQPFDQDQAYRLYERLGWFRRQVWQAINRVSFDKTS